MSRVSYTYTIFPYERWEGFSTKREKPLSVPSNKNDDDENLNLAQFVVLCRRPHFCSILFSLSGKSVKVLRFSLKGELASGVGVTFRYR